MCLKPKRKTEPSSSKTVENAEILFIGEVSSMQLPIKVEPHVTGIPVMINSFPDTGANICLIGPSELHKLRLNIADLEQCHSQIGVAGGSTLTSLGWTNVKITLGCHSTEAKIYFSESANKFFLSRQCCIDLNIVPKSFPYPPSRNNTVESIEPNRVIPLRPQEIPFLPVEGNIPALKKFILDSFFKSAFNREKPFPALSTPPAHIHLKANHIVPKPAY